MNLFTTPLADVTFDDVANYCALGQPETVELDYKRQIPRDLSKHFAAMSNTLGGLIIIGVEEDKTGVPAKWDGVPVGGKLIDQIYQHAANVRPYPACHVYETNEKGGRVFLLVRVHEGFAGPYYQVTDSTTVWFRTGNVSTPLKSADVRDIERIIGKREKADDARRNAEEAADTLFAALLNEAQERRRLQAESRQEEFRRSYDRGKNVVLLRLLLQPYYPTPGLLDVSPREMQGELGALRMRSQHAHFPGSTTEPAPGGVKAMHSSRYDESIHNDQLYTNGLLYHAMNILERHNQFDYTMDHPVPGMVHLDRISMEMYEFLDVARRFYDKFNYRGLLFGSLRLSHASGHLVIPGLPRQYAGEDPGKATLDSYEWHLDLDTHKLNDVDWLVKFHCDQMDRIYWDLGFSQSDPARHRRFLAHVGFVAT